MRAGLESDPIFHATDPTDRAPKSTLLLWQFFLFPLLVVAVSVGIFVFFGAIGGSERSAKDLLRDLRQGGENEQKQAAQQLATRVSKDRGVADPEIRAGMREALVTALQEKGGTDERRIWLAVAVGRTAPPGPSAEGREIADLLLGVVYPPPGKGPWSPAVRLAAAEGLKDMESRDAEAALLRAAADPDDVQIRVNALNGLALLGLPKHGGAAADSPEVLPVLRRALEDPHGGVRQNAAIALALRGDESSLPLLERSLDRQGLAEIGITDPEWQRNALINAIVAARVLGSAALKPLVERLASDAVEKDADVRKLAAESLRHWRNT